MARKKKQEALPAPPEVLPPSVLGELGDLVTQLEAEEQVIPKLNYPESPIEFLEQIIEAHPRNSITLKKLISIGRIIYSDNPSVTACVMNTRPITLMFGRPFLEKNMQTIEDCVYLLHHELTHLILDHFAPELQQLFADKKLGQAAVQIVVDCQVNATCHHTLDDEKYFEFIKRYYPQDQMPMCFMRSDGIPPTDELKALHEKLYSIDGITNEELIEGLMDWFQQEQDKLDQFVEQLLGNHSESNRGATGQNEDLSDIAQEVGQATSDYLKQKKEEEEKQAGGSGGDSEGKEEQDKEGQGGGQGEEDKDGEEKQQGQENQQPGGKKAGTGGSPRLEQVDTTLAKIEYNKRLKQELKRTQVVFPASQLWKAIDFYSPKIPTRSVVPNFHDRRTVALYSKGKMPIFHKHKAIGSNVIVPCYVDVSGSQHHVLGELLPCVSRLRTTIGHKVYCFSTFVDDTDIKDLGRGQYKTSGGTDFNPVAEHILKHRFRFACILTDGQAGLSRRYVEELKRKNVHITVLWTQDPHSICRDPLIQVAQREMYFFKDQDCGE